MNRFKFRIWCSIAKIFTTQSYIMCDGTLVWMHTGNQISFIDTRFDKNYTIQQSTGFFDKNGKEIFEGDIIAVRPKSDKELYTVVWDECRFTMVDKKGKDMFLLDDEGWNIMTEEEMSCYRVVGNIFENQDLIK